MVQPSALQGQLPAKPKAKREELCHRSQQTESSSSTQPLLKKKRELFTNHHPHQGQKAPFPSTNLNVTWKRVHLSIYMRNSVSTVLPRTQCFLTQKTKCIPKDIHKFVWGESTRVFGVAKSLHDKSQEGNEWSSSYLLSFMVKTKERSIQEVRPLNIFSRD